MDFLPLLRKGFWAVADQALFAGANFLLNILLARWMSAAEYGGFTVIYATFLLVSQVHRGMLVEPLMVFGPGRFRGKFSSYLSILLWGHSGFAVVGSTMVALAAAWFAYAGAASLASALWGLALALPFLLFFRLARMVPYVLRKPKQAMRASAIYMGMLMAAVFVMNRYGQLSTPAVLLGMAAGCLVAGVTITARFDLNLPSKKKKSLLADVMREHWKYGHWAVATSLMMWVPGNVYYVLLPLWAGLEQSGALKAVMNMIMPITHAMGAFSTLLVPELVKVRASGRFRKLIGSVLSVFLFGTLAYWLLLGLFGKTLIAWVYAGQYTEYADLLWILGGLTVAAAVVMVCGAALRALESPKWIFWANTCSVIASLTVGLALLALYGLPGAAVGFLVSRIVTAVALGYFLLTYDHRDSQSSGPQSLASPPREQQNQALETE